MIRDPDLLSDLLATVRRFVPERLAPLEDEVARSYRIPAEIADEMRRLGLFGMTIPEEYGGLGVTAEEEMLIAFELGRTSTAAASTSPPCPSASPNGSSRTASSSPWDASSSAKPPTPPPGMPYGNMNERNA